MGGVTKHMLRVLAERQSGQLRSSFLLTHLSATFTTSAPAVPFQVTRTASKQLPVYSDIKNGRTKFVTVVRRIRGDVEAMEAELAKVCNGAPIHRRNGSLEIKGDHRVEVRKWLAELGF